MAVMASQNPFMIASTGCNPRNRQITVATTAPMSAKVPYTRRTERQVSLMRARVRSPSRRSAIMKTREPSPKKPEYMAITTTVRAPANDMIVRQVICE